MLLGTILKRLEAEADAAEALEALGDIVLLTEVQTMGDLHGESLGEYVAGATRRFAADASSEDWLALMAAIERSDDPARTTLYRQMNQLIEGYAPWVVRTFPLEAALVQPWLLHYRRHPVENTVWRYLDIDSGVRGAAP